jgi:hypothetical protein
VTVLLTRLIDNEQAAVNLLLTNPENGVWMRRLAQRIFDRLRYLLSFGLTSSLTTSRSCAKTVSILLDASNRMPSSTFNQDEMEDVSNMYMHILGQKANLSLAPDLPSNVCE